MLNFFICIYGFIIKFTINGVNKLNRLDILIEFLIGKKLFVKDRDKRRLPIITDYDVRRPKKIHQHFERYFAVETEPIIII